MEPEIDVINSFTKVLQDAQKSIADLERNCFSDLAGQCEKECPRCEIDLCPIIEENLDRS